MSDISSLLHNACLRKFMEEELKRLAWKEGVLRQHGKLADWQAWDDWQWAVDNSRLVEHIPDEGRRLDQSPEKVAG